MTGMHVIALFLIAPAIPEEVWGHITVALLLIIPAVVGRSRVWLGDRFCYPGDDLSFDLGFRVEEFHPYESESQFGG